VIFCIFQDKTAIFNIGFYLGGYGNMALYADSAVSAKKDNKSKIEQSQTELIVCGWDEVFILDMAKKKDGKPAKIWSWRAEDRTDLPDDFKKLFGATDECKPFEQGQKILITSSGGGVALVDRKLDEVLFYAQISNAHSADLLPNNRLAVAVSCPRDKSGNRLILFDLAKNNQELLSVELPSGHGAVYDEKRKILWALSGMDIRAYILQDWDSANPKLIKTDTIPLPEFGGHDFYPLNDSPSLSVSTSQHCWLFDRDTKKITPHSDLADFVNVKSICQHPLSRQLVYVQSGKKHWWSDKINFLNPEKDFQIPNEHFYKARWNIHIK
jgi:uncharacterized protein DUF6528